jgi:hypothetical protein
MTGTAHPLQSGIPGGLLALASYVAAFAATYKLLEGYSLIVRTTFEVDRLSPGSFVALATASS